MSIVRRSSRSEVYIYQLDIPQAIKYHCQICSLNDGGDTFMLSRWAVAWHAIEHKLVGHRIPLWSVLVALWHRC